MAKKNKMVWVIILLLVVGGYYMMKKESGNLIAYNGDKDSCESSRQNTINMGYCVGECIKVTQEMVSCIGYGWTNWGYYYDGGFGFCDKNDKIWKCLYNNNLSGIYLQMSDLYGIDYSGLTIKDYGEQTIANEWCTYVGACNRKVQITVFRASAITQPLGKNYIRENMYVDALEGQYPLGIEIDSDNTVDLDIRSGDYISLLGDGKTVKVYLPTYTGDKLIVYVASDGSTYWDTALTQPTISTSTCPYDGQCSSCSEYASVYSDWSKSICSNTQHGECKYQMLNLGYVVDYNYTDLTIPICIPPLQTCNTQCNTCEDYNRMKTDFLNFVCTTDQWTTCKNKLLTQCGSTCNTPADTNCNNCVSTSELISFINKWSSNDASATTTILISVINAWVSGTC